MEEAQTTDSKGGEKTTQRPDAKGKTVSKGQIVGEVEEVPGVKASRVLGVLEVQVQKDQVQKDPEVQKDPKALENKIKPSHP